MRTACSLARSFLRHVRVLHCLRMLLLLLLLLLLGCSTLRLLLLLLLLLSIECMSIDAIAQLLLLLLLLLRMRLRLWHALWRELPYDQTGIIVMFGAEVGNGARHTLLQYCFTHFQ